MKRFDPKRIGWDGAEVSRATIGDRESCAYTSGYSSRLSLSPALSYILKELQRELALEGSTRGAEAQITPMVERVAARLGFVLSRHERDEILSFIESERSPFGLLQPLIDDPSVSDIIVTNYARIAVQQGRRNFSTSISFPDEAAYDAFVERLLLRAGVSYSTKQPIVDGMVGTIARVHAVHKSLCESGPYLTIRINRFSTVTVDDLIKVGMGSSEVFRYLRAVTHIGKTVLVAGEVGTGKTTVIRALASSLSGEDAILVIEDTPEVRLSHPHVRYLATREENAEGAGRVSPHECIRAGMRMAMNRIIFGEIRDPVAAEAFIDVCASGHAGLSTIHARSASEASARLELFLARAQSGTSRAVLNDEIVTAVQVVVFVGMCIESGRRRILEVREIGPVADGVIRYRELFRYRLSNRIPQWHAVTKVSAYRDQIELYYLNQAVCDESVEGSAISQ